MWAIRVVSTRVSAGSRTGKHEKRPIKGLNRLALLRIESIEITHGFQTHGPHRDGQLLRLGRGILGCGGVQANL